MRRVNNMKVISFNRIMGATPIDRKGYKDQVKEMEFVPRKDFARGANVGWVPLYGGFDDLVFEFKGKYFLKIAISTKKISKSMLNTMVDDFIDENPIRSKFFDYDTKDPIEQTALMNEYRHDIETDILKEWIPTTEYVDVVYSVSKDEVSTIAIGSKSAKVSDIVLNLFRQTFGGFEESFHIGLDYDMSDFLKQLVVDDMIIEELALGEKVKLQDPDEKSTTIDYKGFNLEELKDIRNWIINDGMVVANVELTYKNMVFVLDNKYMFSGIKPISKHVIETSPEDITLYDVLVGRIDDYFQMEEIQLLLDEKY